MPDNGLLVDKPEPAIASFFLAQLLLDCISFYDLERDSAVFPVSDPGPVGRFGFAVVKPVVVVSNWFVHVSLEPNGNSSENRIV